MNLREFIKNRILWRVYAIWFLRRIVPLVAVQIVIFTIALKIFARNVFVSKVLQNSAQVADAGYWAVFKYLVSSFLNTHPITQIVILLALGVAALFLRDIARSLFAYRAMWFRRK